MQEESLYFSGGGSCSYFVILFLIDKVGGIFGECPEVFCGMSSCDKAVEYFLLILCSLTSLCFGLNIFIGVQRQASSVLQVGEWIVLG